MPSSVRWIGGATDDAAQQPGTAGPPRRPARARTRCTSDAQVLAFDCRATATSTVGVCSTARRRRNQEVSEMRRALIGRRIAEIHGHHAEAAALDQQVGRLQGVLRIVAAAHPE